MHHRRCVGPALALIVSSARLGPGGAMAWWGVAGTRARFETAWMNADLTLEGPAF